MSCHLLVLVRTLGRSIFLGVFATLFSSFALLSALLVLILKILLEGAELAVRGVVLLCHEVVELVVVHYLLLLH